MRSDLYRENGSTKLNNLARGIPSLLESGLYTFLGQDAPYAAFDAHSPAAYDTGGSIHGAI